MRKTILLFAAMAMANHAFADGSGAMGGSNGQFVGGDRWGRIDTSIPSLDDPIWVNDSRFDGILDFTPTKRPGWGTAVIVTPN